MALCNTCQSQTTRVRTIMTDSAGRLLPEDQRKDLCPNCAPHEFSEPFWTPFERKIWHHEEAFPHLYTTGPDGTKYAKPEVSQDTADMIAQDPDAEHQQELAARKRAMRRTTPSTEGERAALEAIWRPIVADMRERQEGDMAKYNRELDRLEEKYVGRIQ